MSLRPFLLLLQYEILEKLVKYIDGFVYLAFFSAHFSRLFCRFVARRKRRHTDRRDGKVGTCRAQICNDSLILGSILHFRGQKWAHLSIVIKKERKKDIKKERKKEWERERERELEADAKTTQSSYITLLLVAPSSLLQQQLPRKLFNSCVILVYCTNRPESK